MNGENYIYILKYIEKIVKNGNYKLRTFMYIKSKGMDLRIHIDIELINTYPI